MAKKIPSRTAQWPLVAEYTFSFDDTVENTAGAVVDFGKTNTAATSFVAIPLPVGAVVIGGDVTTETAFDAATYNVTVGDSSVANRYLAATDKKSAGITALVPTGYRGVGENIVVGVTAADVCTAGKLTVRVQYIVGGRSNEVQIN
jgi:hypothetical protein